MYLYAKEPLGQVRTILQPCNPTAGIGSAFGHASAVEGFGENPSREEQILRERFARELRKAIESNRIVQAIRRLPEGQVCPAPEHMAEFERRVREKLRGSFPILSAEFEEGINLWRMSLGYPPHRPPRQMPINTAPSMREIRPGEVRQSVIYTAQVLEQKFLIAERSGDVEGMTKAVKEYYDLLNRYPPKGPGDPMPGRGSMERHREQLREIRENLLRQAPNLASIVRHLGPWELARVRGRIAEYLRQRVLARQQRSRVRR